MRKKRRLMARCISRHESIKVAMVVMGLPGRRGDGREVVSSE